MALLCCVKNGPEWPVLLWFCQSSGTPLQRVGRPRCLGDRGGGWIRTDVKSRLDPRPVGRCESCGCPPPATEFVAQR